MSLFRFHDLKLINRQYIRSTTQYDKCYNIAVVKNIANAECGNITIFLTRNSTSKLKKRKFTFITVFVQYFICTISKTIRSYCHNYIPVQLSKYLDIEDNAVQQMP